MKIFRISFIFVLAFCLVFSKVYASEIVQNLYDVVTSLSPGDISVQHELTFTLPSDVNISPSDYVILEMPYYGNINISNIGVSGSFVYGNPANGLVSSVNQQNDIVLTNLSIVGGQSITITGFEATNPYNQADYTETLVLSSDSQGVNVFASGLVNPGETKSGIESVVSVEPYLSTVVLEGYAYPTDFITVDENGATLGTGTPNGTGYFKIEMTGLNPGNHTFSIYGIDNQNFLTTTLTESYYLLPYQTNTFNNIILSPIITGVSPTQITQGNSFTITGEGVPNSNVEINLVSQGIEVPTTSDNNGNFVYTYTQTSNMLPGVYTLDAYLNTQYSLPSPTSSTVNFTIVSAGGSSNPQPNCDISKGDLNCDGIVNISDFSILVYYWGSNSSLADINHDGIVNILDFSIMMYYWGKSV